MFRYKLEPWDADDAAQNACMKALEHRSSFDGDSAIATWLYSIAETEALLEFRRHRRDRRYTASLDVCGELVGRGGEDSMIDRLDVVRTLQGLSARPRRIAERCLAGHTAREIAIELGVSVDTVGKYRGALARSLGAPRFGRLPSAAGTRERARELRAAGRSWGQIAKQLGISRTRASQLVCDSSVRERRHP